jgi:bifunctional DNA-binding transcriptional regulator/antitoxin component of YhaV-PrlF toxin-antitoxin module
MTLSGASVVMAENGTIALPEQIRQSAGFEPGDELWVIWSPPGTLVMRKLSDIATDDEAFRTEMRAFDQALKSVGYRTSEDIIQLMREIKTEQVTEWAE